MANKVDPVGYRNFLNAIELIKNSPGKRLYVLSESNGSMLQIWLNKWNPRKGRFDYDLEIGNEDETELEEGGVDNDGMMEADLISESKGDIFYEIKLIDANDKEEMLYHNPEGKVELPLISFYETGDVCGICHGELKGDDPVCANKNCQHGFHCECINGWFESPVYQSNHDEQVCPTCKIKWENVILTPEQQQRLTFGKRSKSVASSLKKKLNVLIKEINYLQK
jgi:hypothetical protein